jgi:hypothetical protein
MAQPKGCTTSVLSNGGPNDRDSPPLMQRTHCGVSSERNPVDSAKSRRLVDGVHGAWPELAACAAVTPWLLRMQVASPTLRLPPQPHTVSGFSALSNAKDTSPNAPDRGPARRC